jgi:G3E family GTPase
MNEARIPVTILIDDRDEQVVVMNNSRICCTVRGDLVRILGELSERRRLGELGFDRVVMETTGLADPAPLAQTFFVEDAVHRDCLLDAHHEAQEQVGFADRILISKTDLVQDVEVQNLSQRLTRLNPRAPQRHGNFGAADIGDILDIQGFKLDAILEIEPEFLADVSHEHDDEGKPWNLGEARESKMVFFGRNLPRSLIEQGLALCVPDDAQEPTTG